MGRYIIFALLTLYLSVVIGIIIRLKNKGISGKWIILSPILPLFLTWLNITTSFDAIKERKTLKGKIREVELMIRFMTQYFTLLVAIFANRVSKQKLSVIKTNGRAKIFEMPNKRKRKSKFPEFAACYLDVYKSHQLLLRP